MKIAHHLPPSAAWVAFGLVATEVALRLALALV